MITKLPTIVLLSLELAAVKTIKRNNLVNKSRFTEAATAARAYFACVSKERLSKLAAYLRCQHKETTARHHHGRATPTTALTEASKSHLGDKANT